MAMETPRELEALYHNGNSSASFHRTITYAWFIHERFSITVCLPEGQDHFQFIFNWCLFFQDFARGIHSSPSPRAHHHWVGLRENLQETSWFLPSNIGLSCKFSHHPILWHQLFSGKWNEHRLEKRWARGISRPAVGPWLCWDTRASQRLVHYFCWKLVDLSQKKQGRSANHPEIMVGW